MPVIETQHHQRRVANTSISPAALRGHPEGTVGVAISYLLGMNLQGFKSIDEERFLSLLGEHTLRLQQEIRKISIAAQYWGSARKAINLFLENACYHTVLRAEYELGVTKIGWSSIEIMLPLMRSPFERLKTSRKRAFS